MIRTLIFGAIAGYVGKKLYDEGKLTEFKEDLVSRYQQARNDLSNRTDARRGELTDRNVELLLPDPISARSRNGVAVAAAS